MIEFKKIGSQTYADFKSALTTLYLETFTKGLSAQHIISVDASQKIDTFFRKGYGICGFSEHHLVATLIAIPPSFDNELPSDLVSKFKDTDSIYIAEVLVADSHRGLGLGNRLFEAFESDLNASIRNVLLRVWDQNEVAFNLYKKQGFLPCGEIVQQKQKPVTLENFKMTKIYMFKSY